MSETHQPDEEQQQRIAEQQAARNAALERQQAARQHAAMSANQNEILVAALGTNMLANIVYELFNETHKPEDNPHLTSFEGYDNGTALPPRLDQVFNGQGSYGMNYGGSGHLGWLSKNYHARVLAVTSNGLNNFIVNTVCPTTKAQHAFINKTLLYVKLANAINKIEPQTDAEDDDAYIQRILGLIHKPAEKIIEKVVEKVEPTKTAPAKAPVKAPVKTVQKPKAKVVEEDEAEIEEADEEAEESDDADEEEADDDDDDDDEDLDELEEEEDGWATNKTTKARPVAKQVARPVKTAKKPTYPRKR